MIRGPTHDGNEPPFCRGGPPGDEGKVRQSPMENILRGTVAHSADAPAERTRNSLDPPKSEGPSDLLLQVRDLAISFAGEEGEIRAVDAVSFDLRQGESLGLVGESGCGKSVTALSLLRLIPSPSGRVKRGQVLFRGQDLLRLPLGNLRLIRGRSIGMIFQEPMTALSPLQRIGRQLVETLRTHEPLSVREAREKAEQWLARVRLPEPCHQMHRYPHELSGGMRQRVMIAMALMLNPEIVVADEPTTALDVTLQAQIFDLMTAMLSRQTALILITHNMAVIWQMCTRVAVLYAGEIVEMGPVDEVFRDPWHPYTRALLLSMPSVARRQKSLITIPGQVPSATALPVGCRFHERCPEALPRCSQEHPPTFGISHRSVRCFLHESRGYQPEVAVGFPPDACLRTTS